VYTSAQSDEWLTHSGSWYAVVADLDADCAPALADASRRAVTTANSRAAPNERGESGVWRPRTGTRFLISLSFRGTMSNGRVSP